MATMYTCMIFSLAELSSTISTAGGGYGFARRALGVWGGFLTGTAILIEYAMAPAAIVVFIGGYVESLDVFGITSGWPVYLAFYAIFVGVHLLGVGEALKVTFVITAIAVVALLVFVVSMIPEFSTSNLTDIKPDPGKAGSSEFLPFGWQGIWAAFPFAIWFFLAVEGVPLAAEETRDPKKDMPRGLITAMLILLVFAALMLTFTPGRRRRRRDQGLRQPAPGRDRRRQGRRDRGRQLRQHRRPRRPGRELLLDHLRLLAPVVRALAGGLPAARAVGDLEPQGAQRRADRPGDHRLLPRRDHRGRGHDAQHRGLRRDGLLRVDDARAHRPASREPDLERPYRTPGGTATSGVALVLALLAVVATFMVDVKAAFITLGVYALAAAYFAFYSRHHLVSSAPEEEFDAITSASRS